MEIEAEQVYKNMLAVCLVFGTLAAFLPVFWLFLMGALAHLATTQREKLATYTGHKYEGAKALDCLCDFTMNVCCRRTCGCGPS